jgi:hypothetical protein
LKSDDHDSIGEEVKKLRGFKELIDYRNREAKLDAMETPKSKYTKNEKVEDTPEAQLRLSIWFLSKFKSPDQALAVLTAAVACVKACQDLPPEP